MLPAIAARRKAKQGCQPGNRWPATFYQSGSGLGGPTGHAKAPEIRSSGLLRPKPLFCFPQEVTIRRSHEYERKNRSA